VTADGTGDGVPEPAPPALFVVGVAVLGIVGVTVLAIVAVSVVGVTVVLMRRVSTADLTGMPVTVVLRCGWLIARVVRVMVGVDGEVGVRMVLVRMALMGMVLAGMALAGMVVVKRVGHGMHFLPLRNRTCLS